MVLHKLRQYTKNTFLDFGNYRRTIFLAGSGRSGTTWVEGIINYRNDYRVMFEPFHTKKNFLLQDWNYIQYLRPENRDDKYMQPALKILSGDIRNPWIDKINHRKIATRRIVKDIRANLILKWIKQNFPEIPIILLLRHPGAVANSKLQLSGNKNYVWDTQMEDFLSQDNLIRDYIFPFERELKRTYTLFEKYIFFWCIENYVPLKQFSQGEIHVIFYESLCIQPEQTIKNLMEFLETDYDPKVLKTAKLPSPSSRQDSPINTGQNLVNDWQKEITDQQQARAKDIMSLFHLSALYDESFLPRMTGDESLLLLKNS